MSTCDTCHDPGACCKSFTLSIARDWEEYAKTTPLHALVTMAVYWLPFSPKGIGTDPNQRMRWSCGLLDVNGRCSDYENRPELCHHYQAGDDGMCAEFIGPRELTELQPNYPMVTL